MEKLPFRAVIKYFFKILNATQIKDELYSTLRDLLRLPPLNAAFRMGRTSTNDEPCCGRPIKMTTPEVIEKVRKIDSEDRRVAVNKLAETISISTERVRNILRTFGPEQAVR